MKTQIISDLEQKVMAVVWQKKNCLVKDIQLAIAVQKPIAYTTVLTILQRLQKKGLVHAKRKGKVYIYSPKVSRVLYSKHTAQIFLKNFFTMFDDIAIASFAQSIENLPETKRKELLKVIKKYEKNK